MDNVTLHANQEMTDNPPDSDHEAVERTTERLRPPVRETEEQGLRSYVRNRVMARIEEQQDWYKFVEDLDGFVRYIVVEKVNEPICSQLIQQPSILCLPPLLSPIQV